MIRVIHGEIWSEDFTELNNLIRDFQSCVRFCYCRFDKDKLEFNDVRKAAKLKYHTLNTRQISDAVVQGQTLLKVQKVQLEELVEKKGEIEAKLQKKNLWKKTRRKLEVKLQRITKKLDNPKLVFGGRKAWEDLKAGVITKDEWTKNRDNQIYARGDSTKSGNLNIRIIGDILRITVGTRKWATYKLFVSDKFQEELKQMLANGCAYNVRLKRKDDEHFKVIIDYQVDEPERTTGIGFENGVIGVDTNPDRIAVANVSADGNLVETKTFINTRILYGSTDKRNYDIGCLVKKVINYAKEQDKGIVFENLEFKKDKSGNRQWKRMQSNFVWRKFLTLLERKCIEHGIQYKKVNPAFTSIIGKYKYRWMHKISIHESAAYVIGRRGLGYNEKLSFYKQNTGRVKELVLETLAEKYRNKRIHSWVMWKALNDNIEAVLTGLQVRLADLKEFVGNIWHRGETLRGEIFLQELIAGSNCDNNSGRRKAALQSGKILQLC
jgi:IS605 OrfB family transposase